MASELAPAHECIIAETHTVIDASKLTILQARQAVERCRERTRLARWRHHAGESPSPGR